MTDSILPLGLAALFLATGVSKALGRNRFVSTVGAYRLVPRGLAPSAALIVIAGEIVGAVLAVGPEPWGPIGLLMLAAIAGAGTLVAAIDLVVGNTDHPCGCLGQDATGRLRWWHPLRSAIVAIAAVALAVVAPAAPATPWLLSVVLLLALAVAWATLRATVSLQRGLAPPFTSNEVGR